MWSSAQMHRYIINFNSNPRKCSFFFCQMQMRFLERREVRTKGKTSLQIWFTLGGKSYILSGRANEPFSRPPVTACWEHRDSSRWLLSPTGVGRRSLCTHKRWSLDFNLDSQGFFTGGRNQSWREPGFLPQTIQPSKYLKAYVYSNSLLGQWVTSQDLQEPKARCWFLSLGNFHLSQVSDSPPFSQLPLCITLVTDINWGTSVCTR